MRARSLFDEEDDDLVVHPDRHDPLVWIKELRLLESLTADCDLIREPITFRRGLNIISTAKNTGGTGRPVGHNVGKSLLMRLLRYCLGESGFAEKRPRQAICNLFRDGYVVATICVGGTDWHVARPIGSGSASRHSWASSGSPEVLFDPKSRLRFPEFVDQLQQTVISPLPRIALPQARRSPHWKDVVAWLAPDQKCAHKSHVRWRPGGSDPMHRSLAIEDNHVLVRTVMDLLTPDDSGLIKSHKDLQSQQGQLNRKIDLKRAVVEDSQRSLTLKLPDELAGFEGEMLAVAAIQHASNQTAKLEPLLEDELQDDPLVGWKADNDKLQREIGDLQAQLRFASTDLETAKGQLQAATSGARSTELQANADLGSFCHLFHTKQEATDKGCPGVPARPVIARSAISKQREQRCREDIAECKGRISELQTKLSKKEAKAEGEQSAFQTAWRSAEARRKPLREEIERLKAIDRDARRHRSLCSELDNLYRQKASLKESLRESLAIRREADEQHSTNLDRLIRCFNEALRRTRCAISEGTITINARGIFPQPVDGLGSEGEALGTSTNLAFDLGCLLASMSGLGNHPRMLLVDSPRDADIEPQTYAALFEAIAELEALTDEPAFQYILTTTTLPPKQLRSSPYVRLELNGTDRNGLLLRAEF